MFYRISIVAILASSLWGQNNILSVTDDIVASGDTLWLEIQLENTNSVYGVQFDLEYEPIFTLLDTFQTTERILGFNAEVELLGVNTRILLYNANLDPIEPGNGALIKIGYFSEPVYGNYNFEINNAVLGNASSENILTDVLNGVISLDSPAPLISDLSQISFDEDTDLLILRSDLENNTSDIDTPIEDIIYSIHSDILLIQQQEENFLITPPENWFGYDTLVVESNDGFYYDFANIPIEVINVNDPPSIAYIPHQNIDEDTFCEIDLSNFVTDVDESNSLEYDIQISDENILFTISSNHLLTLIPAPDYFADDINIIIYVEDSEGAFDEISFSLDVNPINDAPFFTGDLPYIELYEDSTFNFPLSDWTNFIGDVDNEIGLLSIDFQSTETIEVVETDGIISIIPTQNWFGEDSIQVSISDGIDIVNAYFYVNVLPLNDLPFIEELIEPVDNYLVNIDTIYFSWGGTFDIDDNTLFVQLNLYFLDQIISLETNNDFLIVNIFANDLPYGQNISWNVSAFDGDTTVFSETRNLHISTDLEHNGPEWHINTLGSNINGNGSIDYPFQTIQYGVDVSDDNDTLFISEGEYLGTIEINKNLIIIGKSESYTPTIIDGFNQVQCILIQNEVFVQFINLNFKNGLGLNNEGGALHCNGSALIYVENCNFIDNASLDGNGGAINAENIEIYQSNFFGNEAYNSGGAVHGKNISVHNSTFTNNTAINLNGGGIYSEGTSEINFSLFNNNHSGSKGGGIHSVLSSVDIINNTFYQNSANQGGGISGYQANLNIQNTILWDNIALLEGDQIYRFSGILDINYSDILGGYEGTGNINQDPQFFNASAGLFDLKEGSPCIDAGNPDLDNDGISWVDDVDDQNDDGTRMDIGAFSYIGPDTIPPSVIVVYPNGGENFGTGLEETIVWNAQDDRSIQWAKIFISTNGGEDYDLIDSLPGNTYQYDYIAPENIISESMLVKVQVSDWGENETEDSSDDYFALIDVTLPIGEVLSPNQNTVINEYDSLLINWSAEDNIGLDSTKIFFSQNSDEFILIGSVDADTSSFIYIIPSGVSDNAQILLEIKDNYNNSSSIFSGVFSISDNTPPQVNIMDQDTLFTQGNVELEWDAEDNTVLRSHHLYFSENSSAEFVFIDSVDAALSNFSWSLPNIVSDEARFSIVTYDIVNLFSSDTTDFFTIIDTLSPNILLTYPNFETVILEQTNLQIIWAASDNIALDSIDIYYSSGNEEDFIHTGSISGDSSNFDLLVPYGITNEAKVKVIAYDIFGNNSFDISESFRVTDNTPPLIVIEDIASTLSINDSIDIHWSSSDNEEVATTYIGFMLNELYYPIDTLYGESNTIEWVVPNVIGENSFIKIEVYDMVGLNSMDTSNYFSIIDQIAPDVQILQPTANTVINEYDSLLVIWEAYDNIALDSSFIYYSSNPNSEYLLLEKYDANSGQGFVKIPFGVSNESRIALLVRDDSQNSKMVESDSFIVLDNTPPSLQMLLPAQYSEIDIDSEHIISWEGEDNVSLSRIDLYYSYWNDDFIEIATNLDPNNNYIWKIPNTPSDSVTIMGVLEDGVGLLDTSYISDISINIVYPTVIDHHPSSFSINFKNKYFSFLFSEKMNFDQIDQEMINMNSNHSNEINYELSYNDSLMQLDMVLYTGFAGLDTVDIILNSELIKSDNGYRLDGNSDGIGGDNHLVRFNTGMVVDFNNDNILNADDMNIFYNAWIAEDFSGELGPYIGSIPNSIILPDQIFNIDDMMSFVMHVNWYLSTTGLSLVNNNLHGDNLLYDLNEHKIEIYLPENGYIYELEFLYDKKSFEVKRILENDQNLFEAFTIDTLNGVYSHIGFLENNKKLTIPFKSSQGKTKVEYYLRVLNQNGQEILMTKDEIDIDLIPNNYVLYQNYPNPFNPNTKIRYGLPKASKVQLLIYDILGREVTTLVNEFQQPGYKSITWYGEDKMGRKVGAGMYFYLIHAGNHKETKKMILLK